MARRGMTKSFLARWRSFWNIRSRYGRLGPGVGAGTPLPVTVGDIAEPLEGRLVTFSGVVTGWQGDSIYLGDPELSAILSGEKRRLSASQSAAALTGNDGMSMLVIASWRRAL